MTWTYSGDPSTSPLDEVRFLVGDVDSGAQQISDEEITYVLSEHGPTAGKSVYDAAAVVAEAIAARYSQKADKSVGGLSINYSNRRDAYRTLAAQLRRSVGGQMVGPPQLGGGGQTYLGNEYL